MQRDTSLIGIPLFLLPQKSFNIVSVVLNEKAPDLLLFRALWSFLSCLHCSHCFVKSCKVTPVFNRVNLSLYYCSRFYNIDRIAMGIYPRNNYNFCTHNILVGCPSSQESVCKTRNDGSNRTSEARELAKPRDSGDKQFATDHNKKNKPQNISGLIF